MGWKLQYKEESNRKRKGFWKANKIILKGTANSQIIRVV
jgi:hypothetical protein